MSAAAKTSQNARNFQTSHMGQVNTGSLLLVDVRDVAFLCLFHDNLYGKELFRKAHLVHEFGS
jgi:hypothetical protein